jgi:hypothetical protein
MFALSKENAGVAERRDDSLLESSVDPIKIGLALPFVSPPAQSLVATTTS